MLRCGCGLEEKTVRRLFRIWRSKAIVGWLIWGISSWSKSYRELLRITRGNDTESKMLLQKQIPNTWASGCQVRPLESCSRWDRTWGWWSIHSILVPSALAFYSQVYNIPKSLSGILANQWLLSINKHSSTHSDDITTISSHPTVSSPLILSGSSDGLLTISNPAETDEGEAM